MSACNKIQYRTIIQLIVISSMALSMSLKAALLDLSDGPLYLSGTVKPNIFFTVDDSGSIDWEILTNEHWHHCAYDPRAAGGFSSSDCGWLIIEQLTRSYHNGYRWFEYLYVNNDNQYNDDCSGGERNAIESCPNAGVKDWRVFNADVNVIFYTPGLTYAPWIGECLTNGTLCSDADFNNVRSNPREGTLGYNQTHDLDNYHYEVWIDDKGFSGSRPRKGTNTNVTSTSNNQVDLWDTHIQIVFNGNNVEVHRISYAPDNTGLHQTDTTMATLIDQNACYNILGSESLVRQINDGALGFTSTNASSCRTIPQAKTNVANWYEFHRRRGLAVKNMIGLIVDEFPTFRYGLSVLNDYSDLFFEMPLVGADIEAHNTNLLNALYDFQWPPAGTPLRRGLERAGKYFDQNLAGHTTSPITHSCQQNFSILLTDGLWNGNSPISVNTDVDGDGYYGTLADVARYYYTKDLSNLANEVPPNAYDPATYQHMVTFMVALGVEGALIDTDGDGWPNPPLGVSSNWGNPFSSDLAKMDDMWHGAFNSAGLYTTAKTPTAVLDKLLLVLDNISERISSASSVAQNSTTLQTNSQVYQARFHSVSWIGELLAYPIDLNGEINTTPAWNSGCVLTGGNCALPIVSAANNPGIAPNDRVIITRSWDDAQQGVPFRWPNDYTGYKVSGTLNQRLTNFLSNAPYLPNTVNSGEINENQAYGQALVNYLRGARSGELQNNGPYEFRNRDSILGDIIHSDPLFVPGPNRLYSNNIETQPYSAFKAAYANRDAIIYTGANDGMLHGFNAANGQEVLAYVPGVREIHKKLSDYSKSTYSHQYMVDGSPSENDVFVGGSWQSILAAPLGNGGQGIYALNITDPSTFTEGNANNIFMFEFTDEDDADMGFVSGRITIAKVNSSGATSSRWAVIFGNGYNNSLNDGFASSTGKAALYILYLDDIIDGSWDNGDVIKLTAGPSNVATPNGLAQPYAIDTDGDYIVDYVYAGDLLGNLWKFDLSDADPANWASNTSILFSTPSPDLPITAPPIVGAHPLGLSQGVMVYFGTGKYLEDNDNDPTNAVTQSFYGLWDKLDGTVPTENDLLVQSILSEVSVDVDTNGDDTTDTTYDYRQVSNHTIDWTSNSPHLGWKMNLIVQGSGNNAGERQVHQPILRNNNIIFTTILPSQSACDFGGNSWLMELNSANGGQPTLTPFDVNQDGVFNDADYILVGDLDGDGEADRVPVGGQKSKVGITPTPAVFMTSSKDKEVKVLSGSTGLDTVTENPGSGPSGRQNWREIQKTTN